jgi:hypothetical protein
MENKPRYTDFSKCHSPEAEEGVCLKCGKKSCLDWCGDKPEWEQKFDKEFEDFAEIYRDDVKSLLRFEIQKAKSEAVAERDKQIEDWAEDYLEKCKTLNGKFTREASVCVLKDLLVFLKIIFLKS